MLMIALIGAGEEKRARVAEQIQALSAHVAIFDLRYPRDTPGRLRVLKKIINARSPYRQSLLLLSVKSEPEAQLLREQGALFAVVEGRQPDAVAIHPGDLFVTYKRRDSRHYLTAAAMFSEARRRYQQRRRK